jgi:hypothetical protein
MNQLRSPNLWPRLADDDGTGCGRTEKLGKVLASNEGDTPRSRRRDRFDTADIEIPSPVGLSWGNQLRSKIFSQLTEQHAASCDVKAWLLRDGRREFAR